VTQEANLYGIRNVIQGYLSTLANLRSDLFQQLLTASILISLRKSIGARRFPVEIVRSTSILAKYQQQNRLLVTVVTMVFRTALTSAARRMTLAAASQVSLDDVYYSSMEEKS
jgi:hypothetical protein